jgi:stage II sporulation protein R
LYSHLDGGGFDITAAISVGGFARRCDNIREDTLRLHIIANSNSDKDQENKLAVRDTILDQYSGVLKGEDAKSAAYVCEFLKEKLRSALRRRWRKREIRTKYRLSYAGCSSILASMTTGLFFLPGLRGASDYNREGKGRNWCASCILRCAFRRVGRLGREMRERLKNLEEEPCFKAKLAIVEPMKSQKQTRYLI